MQSQDYQKPRPKTHSDHTTNIITKEKRRTHKTKSYIGTKQTTKKREKRTSKEKVT